MPEFSHSKTELEAVNAILASVGESPVAALDGEFVDAEIARGLLTQESRAVQIEGYTFNTEADFPLAPDAEGRICPMCASSAGSRIKIYLYGSTGTWPV